MNLKFRKLLFAALVIFIILFPIWYFAFGPKEMIPEGGYNNGENAIWLEHEWVENQKSVKEIGELVSKFGDNRIKYVFMHVGPVESNGTIPAERFKYAQDFLRIARVYGDKIKYLAWMGQVRSKIDLANPVIRFKTVQTAQAIIEETGFDGIHYDMEPIYENDSDFIFLLESTKSKIEKNKILSVAINEMIPGFAGKIFKLWKPNAAPMTEDTYRKIAQNADQIAVMTYENGISKPWLYRYFLKNEIIWLTRAIDSGGTADAGGTAGAASASGVLDAGGTAGAGGAKKILVGIPTYEKGINAEAENIENGLLGIIDGLQNARSRKESFLGVAIYINKETSAKEWGIYKKLWMR